MPKTIPTVLAAGLCLALGACNDEPSELAMRDAVGRDLSRNFQRVAAAMASVVGSPRSGNVPQPPAVTAFRKVGCVPSDKRPTHSCEFTLALNGVDQGATKAWFYKGEDGLLAVSD